MSNTAAPATQKVVIVLNGPTDWDEWIGIVKIKAKTGEIWKYMDSSTEKTAIPALQEPDFPMPADVNNQKIRIADLTPDKKEELQTLRQQYKKKSKKYEQQKTALANLKIHIQETISHSYLQYTLKCENTYKMLAALKQCIASTDQA